MKPEKHAQSLVDAISEAGYCFFMYDQVWIPCEQHDLGRSERVDWDEKPPLWLRPKTDGPAPALLPDIVEGDLMEIRRSVVNEELAKASPLSNRIAELNKAVERLAFLQSLLRYVRLCDPYDQQTPDHLRDVEDLMTAISRLDFPPVQQNGRASEGRAVVKQLFPTWTLYRSSMFFEIVPQPHELTPDFTADTLHLYRGGPRRSPPLRLKWKGDIADIQEKYSRALRERAEDYRKGVQESHAEFTAERVAPLEARIKEIKEGVGKRHESLLGYGYLRHGRAYYAFRTLKPGTRIKTPKEGGFERADQAVVSSDGILQVPVTCAIHVKAEHPFTEGYVVASHNLYHKHLPWDDVISVGPFSGQKFCLSHGERLIPKPGQTPHYAWSKIFKNQINLSIDDGGGQP